MLEPLRLGSCCESEAWTYTPENILTIKGTYFCLQAQGLEKPAKFSIICTGSSSKWEPISDSKLHLSSTLCNGTSVCLDVDSNNNIVTNNCKCLSKDNMCDPASQWFKLVESTRSINTQKQFKIGSILDLLGTNFPWNLLSSA